MPGLSIHKEDPILWQHPKYSGGTSHGTGNYASRIEREVSISSLVPPINSDVSRLSNIIIQVPKPHTRVAIYAFNPLLPIQEYKE
jgi:hypothetical protein